MGIPGFVDEGELRQRERNFFRALELSWDERRRGRRKRERKWEEKEKGSIHWKVAAPTRRPKFLSEGA